jgi:transcriptional regulator GlxA family with amidase domain
VNSTKQDFAYRRTRISLEPQAKDAGRAAHTHRYGLLVLPSAAMSDFALASEILTRANQLAGRSICEFVPLSLDGNPVRFRNGMTLPVELSLRFSPPLDVLLIFATEISAEVNSQQLTQGINAQNSKKMMIGGIGCGSYWMARAGLLHQRRSTIHWQKHQPFSEHFPQLVVSSNLYEMDQMRMSCAGGLSTYDFLLALLAKRHGQDFSALLSEILIMERMRPGSDKQRIPLASKVGNRSPKLMLTVSLMEANIEEPLSIDELANYACISRRQLERLFQQYLEICPSRYYLKLRMARARQMLLDTDHTIARISQRCGFSCAPAFSCAYRDFYGINPSQERIQLQRG